MKNRFTLLLVLFALSTFTFISCDDEDNGTAGKGGKYFINYGSYGNTTGTASTYNTDEDTVSNGHYKAVNGVDMVSNPQYAYNYNGNIYLMGNNADQIFYVDEDSFEQTEAGIASDNIVKPRHCIGQGDYLYISCWGGDIWDNDSLSYIIKLNITTKEIEQKISLPGGPEGLIIANDKLYAALSYRDSVAVIQLNNYEISYIATPAVTSYFRKDDDENLYVTLISTWSNFSTETGIGYINTESDELTNIYKLDGVNSTYDNAMVPNDDFSKIYVMTSAYDANWNLNGAIAVFDVESKSFESDMFVDGVSSINGIAVDGDNVFCLITAGATANGIAKKYTNDGTFVKDYEVGISPIQLLNVE